MPSALWLVSDEGPAANTAGPTVGGVARDGSTLTANPGTWEGTPTITYEYQWQRCDAAGANCVNIPGETGSTYTLTPADVGSTIRVLVTAVNDAGSSAPSASAPSATITQLAPSNVTLPQLSGVDRDGQTLTTTIGGWNGTAPLDYDVQWQRCDALGANCADIPARPPGATSWAAPTSARPSAARSPPPTTRAPPPRSRRPRPRSTRPRRSTRRVPAVSGAVRDGQTLTADDGDWTGTDPIAYAYQWQRCDADRRQLHRHRRRDERHLHARPAPTSATPSASRSPRPTSPATPPPPRRRPTAVLADPPANTAVPTLTGSATEG